jgi:tricorn protease
MLFPSRVIVVASAVIAALPNGQMSVQHGDTAPIPAALPSFAEPSLSPDGSEIAFVSAGDIWTVPAQGGDARLLVSNDADESRPLYSPHGKRIACVSTRTGNGDLYELTLATGQLSRLT